MSSLNVFTFRNNTANPIYLATFSQLMIAGGAGTASIAKHEVTSRICEELNGYITTGDLSLLDDSNNPYSAIKALNIIHGITDSVIAGGSSGDVLLTDNSNNLSWGAVTKPPTGFAPFHEVVRYFEQGATGDVYMMRPDSMPTNAYPHFVALTSGSVVHVTSTREKDPTKWCDIVIRKQAPSGIAWASGTWTDIGDGLSMNDTDLYDMYTNIAGYTFAAGDAIAVYLKKTGVTGATSVEDPAVNLYIRYD